MVSPAVASLQNHEPYVNKDYNNSVKKEMARQDLPDFNKVISQSNSEKLEEVEKENKSMNLKNGELQVGESKNDKEFREMLEKITGKKQDKLKNKLEKDDYLNLMVTQLKYQDPTKPIENQEMATQLAQFNTVEQLMGINKLLTEMSSSQKNNSIEKYTTMLGKVLKVEGDYINVHEGGSDEIEFEIPHSAKNVMVEIKDSSDKTVKTISLENLALGSHKVPWDGNDNNGKKIPHGNYHVSIEASSADGKSMKAKSFILTESKSVVDISKGGAIETNSGKYTLDKITAIKSLNEKR